MSTVGPSPHARRQRPPTDAPPARTAAPARARCRPGPARAPADCAVAAPPLTAVRKFDDDAANGRGTVGRVATALKGAGIEYVFWSGTGPLSAHKLNIVELLHHRVPW